MPMNPRLMRPLARRQAPAPGTPASLLLNFDGNFTDSSANALSVTASEGAAVSTAQSKFGGSSAYFPAQDPPTTGQAVVAANANNAFQFGTGDFTLEWWFRSSATNEYACMLSRFYQGPGGIVFFLNGPSGDGAPEVYWDEFGNFLFFKSNIGGLNDGEWHHFAFVRSGQVCAMYVDGTQAATLAGVNVDSSGADFHIGSDAQYASLGRDFSGYIDDVRIVNGLAVYGAGVTHGDFVTPAAALTANATPYANYKPYGTFLFSACDGNDLVGTYADGTGGRYTEVISEGTCE